jgi:hypothetical protein
MTDRMNQFVDRLHTIPIHLGVYAGIATLALSGILPADADAKRSTHSRSDGLRQISQLPGYGIGVSPEAELDVQDSSVIVDAYVPLTTDGYTADVPIGWCSGNKVGYDGHTYISLAAHCEVDMTGVESGLLDPAGFPSSTGALDFIRGTNLQYSVENPNTGRVERNPVANVIGTDVSTEDTDAALLKVQPVPQFAGKDGKAQPGYKSIHALPYAQHTTLTPGERVALFSSPGSSLNPVKAIGRYIGIYKEFIRSGPGISLLSQYVVVTHPRSETDDACYYGASGSVFAAAATKNNSTTGEHGKVVFSGPLSLRDSMVDVGRGNPPLTAQDEQVWRQEVEGQLKVAISPKDTICKYTILSTQTKHDLAASFSNYFKEPISGKG